MILAVDTATLQISDAVKVRSYFQRTERNNIPMHIFLGQARGITLAVNTATLQISGVIKVEERTQIIGQQCDGCLHLARHAADSRQACASTLGCVGNPHANMACQL